MILDANNMFDPSGTAITATANSTNVLDVCGPAVPSGGQGRDIGVGMKQSVRVAIQTALTAAGAATLQLQLLAAPDNGSGAAGTYAILAQTDAIPKASLVAGARIQIPVPPQPPQAEADPPNEITPPRFYKLNYVVATGPFTAGTVQAMLIPGDGDQQIYYPRNFTA